MTTTENSIVKLDALEGVAAEIVELDAKAAEIKARREHLAGILEKAAQIGLLKTGKNDLGTAVVTIRSGAKRLNSSRIEHLYPAEQFPGLYELKLSTKQFRAAFAPNQVAEFETVGQPVLQVSAA